MQTALSVSTFPARFMGGRLLDLLFGKEEPLVDYDPSKLEPSSPPPVMASITYYSTPDRKRKAA